MKLILIVFAVVAFIVAMFLFKKGNNSKIDNNKAATTGKVEEVFYRGKLPFCKFTYQVDGVNYSKKQEISKNNSQKIIHKTYTVVYEKGNPKNAIIKF